MFFSWIYCGWISKEKIIKLLDRTWESNLNYLLFLRIYCLRIEKISLDLALLYLHFIFSLRMHFAKLLILILILIVKDIASYLLTFPKRLHQLISIVIFKASKNILILISIDFIHNSNERRVTWFLYFSNVLNFD